MGVQATKVELAKLILDIESPTLIQKIRAMLFEETSDFLTTLSEQEKYEIKLGLKQLDNGERTSFHDFLKKMQ